MHQFDRRLRLRRGEVSGGLNDTNEAWERWCGRLPAAITSAQADRIIELLERIERRLGDGGRAA